jgi:hypothetical protein
MASLLKHLPDGFFEALDVVEGQLAGLVGVAFCSRPE